ncbi:hypothetical protein G7Y89_g12874 [Cudoniella acicularis]|uniref:Macro domain-containing protein n=1 Tax=Cudoniella acicularis TaxID=354080 RepID=A0A8H4R7Y7_9HELO|nr:hypothetical protein G7Y89_g12874 [Cudoniella acicularis]
MTFLVADQQFLDNKLQPTISAASLHQHKNQIRKHIFVLQEQYTYFRFRIGSENGHTIDRFCLGRSCGCAPESPDNVFRVSIEFRISEFLRGQTPQDLSVGETRGESQSDLSPKPKAFTTEASHEEFLKHVSETLENSGIPSITKHESLPEKRYAKFTLLSPVSACSTDAIQAAAEVVKVLNQTYKFKDGELLSPHDKEGILAFRVFIGKGRDKIFSLDEMKNLSATIWTFEKVLDTIHPSYMVRTHSTQEMEHNCDLYWEKFPDGETWTPAKALDRIFKSKDVEEVDEPLKMFEFNQHEAIPDPEKLKMSLDLAIKIYRKAGPDLLRELDERYPSGGAHGNIYLTDGHDAYSFAFNLLHAPIPDSNEAATIQEKVLAMSQLRSTYEQVLYWSHKFDRGYICFPSLGGAFNFPREESIIVVLTMLQDYIDRFGEGGEGSGPINFTEKNFYFHVTGINDPDAAIFQRLLPQILPEDLPNGAPAPRPILPFPPAWPSPRDN